MSKGHKAAGGIKSRNVAHVRAPKVEPRPNAKVPAGVAQLGQRQGNHSTNRGASQYGGVDMDAGRGYSGPVGPTNNVAAVGVGGGRTIYKTGTQCMTGPVNRGEPMKPNKPLFPGWEK